MVSFNSILENSNFIAAELSDSPHQMRSASFRNQRQISRSASVVDGVQRFTRPLPPVRFANLHGGGRGGCFSQPHPLMEVNPVTGLGNEWVVYRKASFNQFSELSGFEGFNLGACVAYSALWCHQINNQPRENANSRMNFLKTERAQAIQLQTAYQSRMNQELEEQRTDIVFSDAMREMGIILDLSGMSYWDVLGDEANAVPGLAEALHRHPMHFILFIKSSGSGHVAASCVQNGRATLFDPSSGEFKGNMAAAQAVLRTMIANSSLQHAVVAIQIIPITSLS